MRGIDFREKALTAVIQEAWINGVSTRRVEELVQAMGMTGISKSQVSKLCKEIDERVSSFLERPLDGVAPHEFDPPDRIPERPGGTFGAGDGLICGSTPPT